MSVLTTWHGSQQVFSTPMLKTRLSGQETLMGALQAAIAGQLTVLDDASLTETGKSSAQVLGVRSTVLAEKLTSYLLREIVARGASGGPLFPLASQLNHDVTHLQSQRLEGIFGQLADEVREALSRIDSSFSGSVQLRAERSADSVAARTRF